MKYIFGIQTKEVQYLAKEKLGRKLNYDELYRVKKGIEFGLECWEDVVMYAIEELEDMKKRQVGNRLK